jgi:stringent starvation protein B
MGKQICVNAAVLSAYLDSMYELGLGPQIIVDVNRTHRPIVVPMEYCAEDGSIVLQMTVSAIQTYNLCKETAVLTMQASFGGKPMELIIPIEAIIVLQTVEHPTNIMCSPVLTYMNEDGTLSVNTDAIRSGVNVSEGESEDPDNPIVVHVDSQYECDDNADVETPPVRQTPTLSIVK